MSASDSNLSQAGYDTVIGLSQNALNDAMKQYLSAVENDLPPVYYVYTDENFTDTKTVSYDELVALTTTADFPEGIDPFSIADGIQNDSSDDKEAVAKGNVLSTTLFAFAFRATMGLPTGVLSREIPDIISLNDADPQTVNYSMFFETFQIANLIGGSGDSWSYSNLLQPSGSPWIFEWEVNLNLEGAAFESLPQATQDSIKNLDNSSAFSVQQLLLDLSTPALGTTLPRIEGLDSSSMAYDKLTSEFINTYWESLNNNGGAVFYATIEPTDSQPVAGQASIIPTDLNFMVTPYPYDADDDYVPTEEEQGLYTLNYLVMANGNEMPAPISPLDWNWLNSDEGSQNDGVMAIKKDLFVKYLGDLLSPFLGNICVQPTVDMQQDGFRDGLTLHYYYGYENYDPAPVYQTVDNSNDPSHVLSCHFATDKEQKTDNPGYDEITGDGNFLMWSEVISDIHLEGTSITIETTISVYMEIDLFFGVSKTRGYIYAEKYTTIFDITVNEEGLLQVTDNSPSTPNQVLTQGNDSNAPYYNGDLDPSIVATIFTTGTADDMETVMTSMYSTVMSSLMNNYPSTVLNMINDMNAFIFPGGVSYLFKECAFSDHQDLTTMLKMAASS